MNIRKEDDLLMLKFLFNVLQIYLLTVFTYKMLRRLIFKKHGKSKGKKRLSIIGKIWVLISRQLHSSIDGLLTKQSMYLKEKRHQRQQRKSLVKQCGDNAQQDTKNIKEKVVVLKNYQRKRM